MKQRMIADRCPDVSGDPEGTIKILVISDSHGRNQGILAAMKKEEPFDVFLHLGDSQQEPEEISGMVSCPCYMVAGNCDFDTSLPYSRIVEIEDHRILMTHGHRDLVSMSYDYLLERAQKEHCDMAIFGHTHIPVNEYRDGVWILNPGSITWPRQEERERSYMVIYLRKGKMPDPWIRYL